MKIKPWMVLLSPIAIGLLGYILNSTVTALNHGYMPVRVPGGCPGSLDWNHVCMTAQTHLNFLADWMTSNHGVGSPGDALENLAEQLVSPTMLIWAVAEIKAILSKLKGQ